MWKKKSLHVTRRGVSSNHIGAAITGLGKTHTNLGGGLPNNLGYYLVSFFKSQQMYEVCFNIL